jgi:hypothetical protein
MFLCTDVSLLPCTVVRLITLEIEASLKTQRETHEIFELNNLKLQLVLLFVYAVYVYLFLL